MTFPFSRTSSEQTDRSWKARSTSLFFELVQLAVLTAVIVIPLRYFLVQPFYVKGMSMEPSFYDHEYLFIDKLTYRTKTPKRGDVVVIRYPIDPSQYFIKRVVGLPSETVEIANGEVKIYNADHPTGQVLDETVYLEKPTVSKNTITILKSDEYFLMGDNRGFSLDSRKFGPVKRSFIVGRVWVRGYPFDRWRWFSSESYPNF